MSSKSKNLISTSKLAGAVNSTKQANKSQTEPMKCTGRFKDDFDSICQLKNIKYIPEVIARSKRPGSSLQNAVMSQQMQQAQSDMTSSYNMSKGEKKSINKAKSNLNSTNNADTDHEVEQNPEFIELPPKTFTIKDSLEYFKPKIHVEMDHPDKSETVTEIHIKGWRIEKPIFEVLSVCLPSVEQLNTLDLWNVGLDVESIHLISSLLPSCPSLKTLILDNNPIQEPIYHLLLYEENSAVQNLSLRNNCIDDMAARYISYALGDVRRSNNKLLTLNLNSNLIADEGAKSLARALRTNRTLLVLSLANNSIGDEGAKSFSEVISRFQLTFEEILYRRSVLSDRNTDKSPSQSARRNNQNKDRPTSQKSSTHLGVSDAKKKDKSPKKPNETVSGAHQTGGANAAGNNSSNPANNNAAAAAAIKNSKENLAKTKKDDKFRKDRSRESSSISDNKNAKSQKPASKLGKRNAKDFNDINTINEHGNRLSARSKNSALLEISPLADVAENVGENLWLIGNRTLLYLNLSRNNLTEKSVDSFLLALQYQSSLMDIYKSNGTGLLRLVINNNDFASDYATYQKLTEHMKQRDPFGKNQSVNQETESTSGKDSSLGRNTAKSGIKH